MKEQRQQIFARDPHFLSVQLACQSGDTPIYLHGIQPGSLYEAGVYLHDELQQTVVLVFSHENQAKNAALNGAQWTENIYYYPSREVHFFNIDAVENKNEKERLRVLTKLARKEPIIVCTTMQALAEKITTPAGFLRDIVVLKAFGFGNIDRLREQFLFLRYNQVPRVESPGEFSIRGGILDIFPTNEEFPVRVEFFDTEIDSLRTFDIGTQRSIDHIDEVQIGPAKDMLMDAKDKGAILQGIEEDIDRYEKKYKASAEEGSAVEKFLEIHERVKEGLSVENMHLLLPYLEENQYASLLDYVSEEGIVIVDDLSRVYDTFLGQQDELLEQITMQLERGEVFPRHEHVWYKAPKVVERLEEKRLIHAALLMKRMRMVQPKRIVEIKTLEAPGFSGQMEPFFDWLEAEAPFQTILLALGTKERVDLMREHLFARNLPIAPEGELPPAGIALTEQNFIQGVQFTEARFTLFTHKEIYGRAKVQTSARKKKKPKSRLVASDLQPGDYVVHENQGIGRFEGFQQLTVNEHTSDYLVIQYFGKDKLYLPPDQMHLIQKYIGQGKGGKEPKLNRLNSPTWRNTKAKARRAVEEIADDLVRLYASRAKKEGYAFQPDTPWQREFEEDFLYEETQGQLRSIDEIKLDMEKPRPMDRILCGDVGYGKTEVALRAAFKAIMDGKQVAFLCPTTILAQQHYQTARERFRDFPVGIEVLSRFVPPARSKEILQGLKTGSVDFVVGTHRLLSKDLKFKDLGLLIIDEEQRFGVQHKEKLKKITEAVDVLTLSATPIPRTLQMGLIGIRDMSVLDEPPQERFPTTTYVLGYDRAILAGAIRRELSRDGQVYFVYNRVHDIDRIAAEIHSMVPEARVGIGHGQMSERELENVMQSFIQGEIDVLLSTTIIETGLDIQNVNTMIVYDADKMGLSQLYQLKGRIGRSNRTSYAYFTYEKDKVLQETAEKRLMAIRDFSEFGSGYKIAMRDLELRGAGNLLGESQSGHIEAIGYDLYVRFLEEAIQSARGETKEEMVPIELEVTMDGYIPEDYISDADQKIEVYQRIASLTSEDEFEELVEDLIDRFGDIPNSVYNIIVASRMKSLAQEIGFAKITENKKEIVFSLQSATQFSLEQIAKISSRFPGKAVFNLSDSPTISYAWQKDKLKDTLAFLEMLQKDIVEQE